MMDTFIRPCELPVHPRSTAEDSASGSVLFAASNPICRLAAAAALLTLAGCLSGTPVDGQSPSAAPPAVIQAPPEQPPSQDDSNGETADQRLARQINLIAPILEDTTTQQTDARRLAAAQELLAMQAPEAIDVLERALRSGNAPQMIAVIRAVEGQSVPQLLRAAVDGLVAAPPTTVELLDQFLARNESRVLQDVAQQALNNELLPEQRVNAITALGWFRTRDAAERLMSLLEDSRKEPASITNVVCESLKRLTRLSYGNDPAAWRTWWAKARQQSREDWLVDQVQRLAGDRAELERELNAQRQRSRRIEQRVVDVLRELFRELPNDIDKQLAPLPALLDDELTIVRLFAIERIRFVSRDLEIPTALKEKLATRLDDSESAVRSAAARLLHDLNATGSSDMFAARLADESSPETAAVYIELLISRPSAQATAALVQRMGDPAFCDAACSAIWSIIDRIGSSSIDTTLAETIGPRAHELAQSRGTASTIRLACYFAATDELPSFEKYLDQSDSALRIATAEAFAARQQFDPLVSRAADAATFPILMRGLGGQPATIDNLKRVLSFPLPDDTGRMARRESVSRILTRLPADQSVLADDAIAASNVSPDFRAELIGRLLSLPVEQVPAPQRTELTIRLATLQLAQNQNDKAHQTLEALRTPEPSPELRALKFKAAALAKAYDRAAEFESNPESWITLLTSLAASNKDAARALQSEVDRRFAGALNEELTAACEALRKQLVPAQDNASSDPTSAHASEKANP